MVKGDFLAGLRYDVESYFEKEEYSFKYVLEKFFLQVDKPTWDIRLGDYYTNLGRGLTLSVLKNDQFGEDSTIQGAIGNIKTTYINFKAFGGYFNEGDSLEYKPYRAKEDDPDYEDRDILFGGSLVSGDPNYVLVGVNFVGGLLPVPEDAQFPEFENDDTVYMLSGSLESPDFRVGSFYGEYGWLEYKDAKAQIDDVEYEGRGGYAGLTLYWGPLNLISEAQDYYLFDFAHNDPPNLEYEKTAFTHLPRLDDILGFRNRLDYVIPVIDTLVYGVYYKSWTHEETPVDLAGHYSAENREDWIQHGYGGLEKTFDNAAFVFGSGGYRENPEGHWIHGELDGGIPIISGHEISAATHLKQFYGERELSMTEYGSQEYLLSYAWAPYLTITGSYEYSDEPISSGVGADVEQDDPNFYAGEIKIEPNQRVRINLFYGRQKGGLKCSSGICRVVPPFEGAKMDLALRF